MNAQRWAQIERQNLCDLLEVVGPDAPTLCEGWSTAHLAAHLVLRERKPIAALGIIFGGAFAQRTERTTKRLAATSFDGLIKKLRKGPPLPLKRIDGQINVLEYTVHHEDIRRAFGEWEERQNLDELQEIIWKIQKRSAHLMTRKLEDIDLTLCRPSGETTHINKSGRPATLIGEPIEIAMFITGRRDKALVEISGDDSAIEEIRTGSLGY
ncbi:MAG TPA: TIGR03085 family metal-binding protein [Acidimicrobiales bacterium]|jgi:uncharacterized protein (TIGR03085 family)|nr:TIGR03085 family metal-binding protein [Acidimicrobiales bacterium]|tara:strand:- start:5923 stop:6555 length:633 start_codon:yes stop_codon:yes gene_type:complete